MPVDVKPDQRHPDFDSLFEQRVFLDLVARGYHVNPQVEVNNRRIDLVVTGAEGRLAVECDGDAFHSTPEQRERDLERERELKRCGWEFWRIRESEYYLDAISTMADLLRELDHRGIAPGVVTNSEVVQQPPWRPIDLVDDESVADDESDGLPGVVDEPQSDTENVGFGPRTTFEYLPVVGEFDWEKGNPGEPERDEAPEASTVEPPADDGNRGGPVDDDRPSTGMYREAPRNPLGGRDDFGLLRTRAVKVPVTAAIREIIDVEGPVAVDRITATIVRRFGFERARANRQEEIRKLIPRNLIRSSDLGSFAWPPDLDPSLWRGFRRTPPGLNRPLNEVAPEEIINAMDYVCDRYRIYGAEQLMRSTLAVFDQTKLTENAKRRLGDCIELAVVRQRLYRDDVDGSFRSPG